MSAATIKLNSVRLLLLRAAMKKEELRLQSAAAQVARIASGLEMEVAAKSSIDASLTKLRKQLKQDAEHMATMQKMADLAMSELSKKDSELAERARNLDGTMQRFQSLAGSTAGGSDLIQKVPRLSATLDLTSQLAADSARKLGDLFGLADEQLTDRLQGFDLHDLFSGTGKKAAGAAGVGAVAAGAATIALTDAWDSCWNRPLGQNSSGSRKSKKKESLFSKAGSAISSAAGSAASWVSDKAGDVKDWAEDRVEDVKDFAGDVKDWAGDKIDDVKDWAGDALEDARDTVAAGGKWVANTGSDIWKGMKAVAKSKPVGYLKDTAIDVIGGGADILSFCKSAATLDGAGVVTAGYDFVNSFFDVAQDSVAVVSSGIGAGIELFGGNEDAVEYFYDVAADYAGRSGLADELHSSGFDIAGTIVDGADTAVGVYKTVTLTGKLFSGEIFKSGSTLKEDMLTGLGWKSVGELDDAAEYVDRISHYSNLVSNVKTGVKYADGFLTDPLQGLKVVWDTSMSGKLSNGAINIVETVDEVVDWATGQD